MRRLFRLWSLAGSDLKVLYAALRSRNRPAWLIFALIALILFALDPLNLAIPVLGVVDDFVLLPLLIRVLARLTEFSVTRLEAGHRDARVVSVQ